MTYATVPAVAIVPKMPMARAVQSIPFVVTVTVAAVVRNERTVLAATYSEPSGVVRERHSFALRPARSQQERGKGGVRNRLAA